MFSRLNSIRARVMATGLLPVACLFAVGALQVEDAMESRVIAQQTSFNVRCYGAASGLVDAVQKERGRTAMFLSGKSDHAELAAYRKKTDEAAVALESALHDSGLPDAVKSAGVAAYGIEALRSEIGARIQAPSEAVSRYSALIARVIATMDALSRLPTAGGIDRALTSQLVIEAAKESTGRLRGTLSGLLGVDAPIPNQTLRSIMELLGGVRASLESKALAVSDGSAERIRRLPEQAHWREIDRVIAVVVEKAQYGEFGIDPEAFWAPVTRTIDDLGSIIADENQVILDKAAELEREARAEVVRVSGGFVAVLIATLAVSLFMASRISGPVRRATEMLKDIAAGEGDLTKRLEVRSRDEIGQMATSFNTFVSKIQAVVREVAATAETLSSSAVVAKGMSDSLTKTADEVRERTQGTAAAVSQVSGSVNTVAAAAEESSINMSQVAAAVEEMSSSVTAAAAGAEEMSANVGSVSAAVEQMSASLREVAQNCQQSANASRESSTKAQEAMRQMGELDEAARRIGKVVELIENIADKTNLLALNATIEAASAGEAGKGFAVVAGEVKSLARQTAKATDEIADQVKAMQSDTQAAVAMIRSVAELSEQVNDFSSMISAAVEEQSATTNEISKNTASSAAAARDVSQEVQQVSSRIGDVSRMTVDVSTALNEIARSSGEAASGADVAETSVAEVVSQLTVVVGSANSLDREAELLGSAVGNLNRLVGQFRI